MPDNAASGKGQDTGGPVGIPKFRREPREVLPVLTLAEAEGLPHVSWMLAGVSGGGHEVNMVITYGGGTKPVGVQVTETQATVTLTVCSKLFPPGTPFRLIKRTDLFRVRLPTPLGSRRLRGFSGRTHWPPRVVLGHPGTDSPSSQP